MNAERDRHSLLLGTAPARETALLWIGRAEKLKEAVLYLAGHDVAGWEPHMRPEEVLAKVGVDPVRDALEAQEGCERHRGDPHNLCPACWETE